MPLMSERYPQYVMHERELKEVLGLGRKLPERGAVVSSWYRQGYLIELLKPEDAKLHSAARKPHRLVIRCKKCSKWFSAGRLAQHEKACLQ